jgi:hypothetical protein
VDLLDKLITLASNPVYATTPKAGIEIGRRAAEMPRKISVMMERGEK